MKKTYMVSYTPVTLMLWRGNKRMGEACWRFSESPSQGVRWKVIEGFLTSHGVHTRHRHRQAHLHECLCWSKLTN